MRSARTCGRISGGGVVVDGLIRCPLHGWEYAADGKCVLIPMSKSIPPFACQVSYPTVEMGGLVFFCNAPVAPFAMPFFEGRAPGDLFAAAPFELVGEVPWYLIGANGFDFQHFHVAHDRKLMDTPVIDCPSPGARRIAATFEVTGTSMRDRLTRTIAGPTVRMTITSWAGTNILVTAQFKRTTTYGMVCVSPLPRDRSGFTGIACMTRSSLTGGSTIRRPFDSRVNRISSAI